MSQLFPTSGPSHQRDPERTHTLDPRRTRAESRRRWTLRAAEYRALALARAVFGDDVALNSAHAAPGQAFRGILTLEVPFRSLEDHRLREEVFLECARRDEVTARVPFIYVFTPVPVGAGQEGP